MSEKLTKLLHEAVLDPSREVLDALSRHLIRMGHPIPPEAELDTVWVTEEGTEVPFGELGDRHLLYCLRAVRGWSQSSWRRAATLQPLEEEVTRRGLWDKFHTLMRVAPRRKRN